MYEYKVVRGGYEQTVKFFAVNREEADAKAAEWVGDDGSVIAFVGYWSVTA